MASPMSAGNDPLPPARPAFNPFRAKAERVRSAADRLSTPSARDAAMADAFPLGVGYGRKGGEKRLASTIRRAGDFGRLDREARYRHAQADAFDRGEITAQGRRRNPAFDARSDKAAEYRQKRAERVAAAKAIVTERGRLGVTADVWADSCDVLGGPARALVMHDHAEFLAAASGGKS